jgi:hypothetical protein
MEIKWEYESRAFILKNGKELWPDFFLPELNTWLEAKGKITREVVEDFNDFSKEYDVGVALLSEEICLWLEDAEEPLMSYDCDCYPERGYGHRDGIYYGMLSTGQCLKCGAFFFCGVDSYYTCRKCGFHDKGNVFLRACSSARDGIAVLIELTKDRIEGNRNNHLFKR